jgi:hypothetical protein
VHGPVVDRDNVVGIEIDFQLAGSNRRFRVSSGTANDRLNTRGQFATFERPGQEVIGAATEKFDLLVELTASRED